MARVEGDWVRAGRRDAVMIAARAFQNYVMRVMTLRRMSMPSMAFTTVSRSRPLLLLAALGGAIMAAALGLWAYYGTAVFFEIVRTGWIACF